MRRLQGMAAFVAAALTAVAPGATITQRPDSPLRSATIYVRIYDYAGVPSHILDQAKTHAARVFERAGIELVWLPDPLHPEASDGEAVEAGPVDLKRQFCQLSVRIYPPKMSRRLGMEENVFGYALQPEGETGFGAMAIVFGEKAESLAKEGVISHSVALGHAIAHEVGHLLLGSNSHSGYGIMHVPWRRAELKRAATGLLNFTPRQVQRIRKGLVARYEMAAARVAAMTDWGGFRRRARLSCH